MKLYRLTILGYSGTIDRAVWADWLKIADDVYYFMKDGDGTSSEIVASYPVAKTIITNVETKEAYEERRNKESADLQTMGRHKK